MYLRNLFFLISRLDPIHNTKSQSSLSVRSRNFCCPILKYAAASSKVKFAFSQKGISFILRTHLSDSCKSHVSSPFDLLSHIFNTQITESLSFSFLLDFWPSFVKDNRWMCKYYQFKFFTSKRKQHLPTGVSPQPILMACHPIQWRVQDGSIIISNNGLRIAVRKSALLHEVYRPLSTK